MGNLLPISNRPLCNMPFLIRKWALPISILAALVLAPGCNQQSKVTVSGSVVRGGQPIACSPTGYVQVTLMPDVSGQEYTTRQARCETDGSFKVVEVPPGKYKIGVEQWDPNPQIDKLSGAYRVGDSKVIRDIDGKTPLTIDLAKPNLGL
jgi:hypothetical protein